MSASTPKELYNSPRTRFERGILTYDLSYYFTASTQAEADAVGKDFSERRSFPGIDIGSRQMYAKQVQCDKVGANAYMLYVTASVGDDSGAGTTTPKSKDDFATWVSKDMSQKEMVWKPEWFGAIIADENRGGLKESKIENDRTTSFKWHYFPEFLKVDVVQEKESFSSSSKIARKGDYVFRNHTGRVRIEKWDLSKSPPSEITPKTYDDTGFVAGTIDQRNSPYLMDDSLALDMVKKGLIGLPFKVDVYQVSFYTRTKFNSILPWRGLNPSGDSGFGSTSRRSMSPYSTVQHQWRAIDQKFSYQADKDGDIWTKITRTMESSPYDSEWHIVWDIDRSIYGEWTWGRL